MKIFSASQVRAWDKYTIQQEPISSIGLMERASRACFQKIIEISNPHSGFVVFAGPGNNGGDGFAIARMLKEKKRNVTVYHFYSDRISEDCKINRQRWIDLGGHVTDIIEQGSVPSRFKTGQVIIDAIFGTGQSRPLEGIYAVATDAINRSGLSVISVDLPSGIRADESSLHLPHIQANFTLSLQAPKLCFFLPENHEAFGRIHVIDIGLWQGFYDQTDSVFQTLETADIKRMLKPRDAFAHKGNFGQALLLAGSRGMMGASLLAAKACLRTGTGKVYSAIPSGGLIITQSALPEAICLPDPSTDVLTQLPGDLGRFQAIGAGPGIGKAVGTRAMVKDLLDRTTTPLILDADALNIIAEDNLMHQLPKGTIITPHIGEFNRLFGTAVNDFDRTQLAMEKARESGIYIILKGRYTLVTTPQGKGYFNVTGNPGMAKGGSGDVLTGMITGLIAQQYTAEDACKLAVCLHGIAGDLARDRYSEQAMLATDIIEEIGNSFRMLA